MAQPSNRQTHGPAHALAPLDQYLTVSEAALVVGVSASTLRNWDRAGKLAAYRHPVNGYRLYSPRELHRLLKSLKRHVVRA